MRLSLSPDSHNLIQRYFVTVSSTTNWFSRFILLFNILLKQSRKLVFNMTSDLCSVFKGEDNIWC